MSARGDEALRAAEAVDPIAAVEAFLTAGEDPWRAESHEDFEKALLSRLLDAAGPTCLKAARMIADRGPFEADGIRFAPCEAPNRWTPAFKAIPPDGHGLIFAIKLDVPMRRSATFRAMAEGAGARRAPTGQARGDLAASIIDEILLEERLEKDNAYPDDLPDPDTVDAIDRFGIYAFGIAREPQGDLPGQVLAALRHATIPGEGAVLASIATGAYAPTRIAGARPSTSFDGGPWMPGTIDAYQPFAWTRACEALGAALRHLGLEGEMAVAARAVAARRYRRFSDKAWAIALHEAGASCAAIDGPLPGKAAHTVEAMLEAGCVALRIGRIAGSALRLSRSAASLGATHPDEAVSYNDLDNTACALVRGDTVDLDLTDQNGQIAVILTTDGDRATSIAAARYGLPLEDYLSGDAGEDLLTPEVAHWREAHRDYANPHDPLSPLGRGDAFRALREGRDVFPGFLGRYAEAEGGRWTAVTQPALDLRTIKDVNLLDACVQSGEIEVGELAGIAARPDVVALLAEMTGEGAAIDASGARPQVVAADGTRRSAPDAALLIARTDLSCRGRDGLHRATAMGRTVAALASNGAAQAQMADSHD